MSKNPFVSPIRMRALRLDLFGVDRIPKRQECGVIDTPVLTYGDWVTTPIGTFTYKVIASTSTGTRSRRGRNHRLYVQCPACQQWVPAGRAHQHGRVHETKAS